VHLDVTGLLLQPGKYKNFPAATVSVRLAECIRRGEAISAGQGDDTPGSIGIAHGPLQINP
jgi:hypothetical protein